VAVERTIQRRLAWGTADDWPHEVLGHLHTDRGGAMRYAAAVIAYEQLPPAQRQRVKAERRFAFLKGTMRGKPVTAPQAALLRTLGYQGPPPSDRAEASRLIEALLHGKGVA
jgi:hypothetical protein